MGLGSIRLVRMMITNSTGSPAQISTNRWPIRSIRAAEIALGRPHRDPDDGRQERQSEAEQHRQPEPVDDPGGHVPGDIVGAEPVTQARRFRHRAFGVEVDGVVAERDDRPQHPAVAGLDQLLDVMGRVHRLRLEHAAEFRFRVEEEHRCVQFALVAHDDRLVVGDELREQGQDDQDRDDPQAHVAATVGLEVRPSPPRQRGDPTRLGRCALIVHDVAVGRRHRSRQGGGHQVSRVSKSIRGSTRV